MQAESDQSRRVGHQEFMRGAAAPASQSSDHAHKEESVSASASPSRRRTGPSTNVVPNSFAYGAGAPNSSSHLTAGRTLGSRNPGTSASASLNSLYQPLTDTSVNIANALQQAGMPTFNTGHSSSSLAGSTLTNFPSNGAMKPPSGSRKPNSSSSQSAYKRAKSPEDLGAAARAHSPFYQVYLKQQDPTAGGGFQSFGAIAEEEHSRSTSVDDSTSVLHSRDYSILDQRVAADEANAAQAQDISRSSNNAGKVRRKQANPDNTAYKPAPGELDDDESSDDDTPHRRRKKKSISGRATLDGSLPVLGASKKRKSHGSRKSLSKRGVGAMMEDSVEDEDSVRALSPQLPDTQDTQPPPYDQEEEHEVADLALDDSLIDATTQEPAFSPDSHHGLGVGQLLGKIWIALSSVLSAVSNIVSFIFRESKSVLFARPAAWAQANSKPLLIVAISGILLAYMMFAPSSPVDPSQPPRRGLLSAIFGRSPRPYTPPSGPMPDNWDDFTTQLASMQSELATISRNMYSTDHDQSSAIRAVERRIESFGKRYSEIESRMASSFADMQHALDGVARKQEKDKKEDKPRGADPASLERLSKLEAALDQVQDTLKRTAAIADASPIQLRELEKKFAAFATAQARSASAKSPKDVSPALADYFQTLLRRALNDRLGMRDFAIFSGGGRIIPTLTSPTYEIPGRRRSWLARAVGMGERSPSAMGRPPATALTPDINIGNCWPFNGSKGHLGVYLARSIHISSVSIDHISKDVAFDTSPAPKQVRVWGIVDGQENLAKLASYREGLEVRKEVGSLSAEELDELDAEKPADLGHKGLEMLQIASFAYDVQALDNVQTFAVPARIQELGIDMGVVIFDILSNHGNADYTCLYRARVHGSQPVVADERAEPEQS